MDKSDESRPGPDKSDDHPDKSVTVPGKYNIKLRRGLSLERPSTLQDAAEAAQHVDDGP